MEKSRSDILSTGVVDFGTNFHGLILLVVELAILLDLQFVVLLDYVTLIVVT
ncbi:hypothetical protein T03_4862 [Trichinella britovi]|uniref:Uncharacterized protein n=1 Tax=Trichinella britovi TaxID=45882 RepID=A0A0V1B5Y9_TRIBR|nr:hypothetical protein T03_4862 [Trichinella britovi]